MKSEKFSNSNRVKSNKLKFSYGLLFGFLSSCMYGILTDPNSTFEGASGFHWAGMFILIPIVSIISGIVFYVLGLAVNDKEDLYQTRE